MKTYIVIRHATADGDRLNDLGRSNAISLGKQLESRLDGKRIVCLSSPRARSWVTASLVIGNLDIETKISELLFSDDKTNVDAKQIFEFIRESTKDHDICIVVTHLEISTVLPTYIMSTMGHSHPEKSMLRGQATIIDITKEQFKISHLYPQTA